MKITSVKTILANRFLFVEIETDEGIKGVGEVGPGLSRILPRGSGIFHTLPNRQRSFAD